MTTPKRPRTFGDNPAGAPGARPLPLVTQAMGPIPGLEDAGNQTRIDNPLAHVPESLIKATAMVPAEPKVASTPSPAGPPPELGLTQHHLPTDEGIDPRLVLVREPDGERAAAFRVLRHHLLEIGKPQVIVVSSPQRRDGKTTTAINLALALAECGRAKVLLAETHVAHPQLAHAFRCSPPWCFAEQLAAHRNQPMLPWSLIEIPQLWLHLAPINPRIEQNQLLDAPAFAIAMERLRLAYDHIVIDAPPVLGSADVNLMADAADGVLLALRARRSTTRDLRTSVEQLGANKVAGTVIVE
jgi:Mrp family chromosome partitioning ATPase